MLSISLQLFKYFGAACIIMIYMQASFAQLTIHITTVPPNTPPGATIYIAGNFNSWNPGHPVYTLTDNMNGTYSIIFSPNPGLLEFKFTRGSWETVEGTSSGGFRPNRTYSYTGGEQSLELNIAGWEGGSGNHTAEDNVQILDENFFIPQLNRHRRIWLYLPPDYHTSTKRYPVIYMQDGQNLFDAYYSFAGEWKIDESMNDLFEEGDAGAIVVGIDNGGSQRIDEYSPWVNPQYGGGDGEAYAAFLVQTLKPYIDTHFRTLPERDFTAIGGSSLGANISMFTAIEYQDVFSKVGIFSPAFWFSDSSYLHLQHAGIQMDLRIYFIAGQQESSTKIPNMMEMYNALVEAGQTESEMHFISSPDGAHSEWFWAREYPDAYSWLFEDIVLSDLFPINTSFLVYPNPAGHYVYLPEELIGLTYTLYSAIGQQLASEPIRSSAIDTSRLHEGIYILLVTDHFQKTVHASRFVKH